MRRTACSSPTSCKVAIVDLCEGVAETFAVASHIVESEPVLHDQPLQIPLHGIQDRQPRRHIGTRLRREGRRRVDKAVEANMGAAEYPSQLARIVHGAEVLMRDIPAFYFAQQPVAPIAIPDNVKPHTAMAGFCHDVQQRLKVIKPS